MERKPSLVVLAVEGLRASALGAYGATGGATPALDELAAQGTTFEWCYSPIVERTDSYDHLWSAMHTLADVYGDGQLVTDYHPVLDQAWRHVFLELIGLNQTPPNKPADSLAETNLANVFEKFDAAVHAMSPPYENRLVWLHTQGLVGPWDAPLELAAAHCDEEDPPPYAGLTPPEFAAATEDDAFRAAAAYAAQVQVLDACVAALRASLAELEWGPVDFCLLGLSGYSLGEHGVVSPFDNRLFSEQHHVPAIIARGDGRGAFHRERKLLRLNQLLGLRFEEPAEELSLQLHSPSGAHVLRTPQWMLRRTDASSPPELYVKPDDRWEANNIASRLAEEAERLTALLAPPTDLGSMILSNYNPRK